MTATRYCAVYDFELMPYALGDVLTWNIQTAIRCESLGRERVDVFICLDERYPASIYQRGMVTAENCGLFFSELFSAFGTHPLLGGIFVFGRREEMLERLHEITARDAENAEAIADYEQALARRDDEVALNEYFTKYIYFHEGINAFARQHGRIPLLQTSRGCEPDVRGLLERRLAGRAIVPVHVRLRRVDAGYAGEHTYARDSEFLEWYEFLRESGERHPEVQFVVLGRLQEKPIELLRLPSVMSLRSLGLGLGHELTLMLHSDLFIGTSSGFAAMANFSRVPYFITKMNAESCNAYRIRLGQRRLPFATRRQILVYEPETRDLLMRLLARGLRWRPLPWSETPINPPDSSINVRGWPQERTRWLYPGATTGRLFLDERYSDKETAFLVWPTLEEARRAWQQGLLNHAWKTVDRVESNFPRLSEKFPDLLRLRATLAFALGHDEVVRRCESRLRALGVEGEHEARFLELLTGAGEVGANGTGPPRWRWPVFVAKRFEARPDRQKVLAELGDLLVRLAAGRPDA